MQYFINSGKLKFEGTFSEKQYSKPVGTIKYYSEKGFLKSNALFSDSSTAMERTYCYENGNKRSWINYANTGKTRKSVGTKPGRRYQIVLSKKEARFPGGLPGWRSYLEQNLNANVAADAGAPAGVYTVAVQFIVNKEGMPSRISPTTIPEKCTPCATEVVRILSKGPKWEPATINGEPVLYQAIQQVSFQVIEEGRRKRRKIREVVLEKSNGKF